MECLKSTLKKLPSLSGPKLNTNPYDLNPSNPYHLNSTSQPANLPHPPPSSRATQPFQPKPRPASPREPRDYLAEAREVASRDHVTGKKKGKVRAMNEMDAGAAGVDSGTGYDAYVREMKRRREEGWTQPKEYFAPEARVRAEYYAPGSGVGK